MTGYELTSEQKRVYSFIVRYRQQTGFPPTVREIAQGLATRVPIMFASI
jgi:SOS-response transcriptional repressor LexA